MSPNNFDNIICSLKCFSQELRSLRVFLYTTKTAIVFGKDIGIIFKEIKDMEHRQPSVISNYNII